MRELYEIALLRVIPTVTISCHRFWHLIWNNIYGIYKYVQTFYSGIYSDFLFCHSIWHSLWHSFWHSIWFYSGILFATYSDILSDMGTAGLSLGSACWDLEMEVEMDDFPENHVWFPETKSIHPISTSDRRFLGSSQIAIETARFPAKINQQRSTESMLRRMETRWWRNVIVRSMSWRCL